MYDAGFLNQERSMPSPGGKGNVVQWRVFRTKTEAEDCIRSVRLEQGQRLVGGYSRDSIGPLWWVGVQVDDIAEWGNRQAINKRGAS